MTAALFDLTEYDAPRDGSDVLETCDTGSIAELEFLPRAKRNGWHVYSPHGHSTPADVILFRPPAKPVSVQIKKGVFQKDQGKWKIMVGSGKPSCAANPKDYGARYTRYQRGDFDVLAMYVDEHDCFVFWSLDQLVERGLSAISWRVGDRADNWDIFDLFTASANLVSVSYESSAFPLSSVVTTSLYTNKTGEHINGNH
jgi:hypothetical protein